MTCPPTISPTQEHARHHTGHPSVFYTTGLLEAPLGHCTPSISYTLPQHHLQPLPQELSDNSPSSRYNPPGRTLRLEFPAVHTKRAASPAAQTQRSTWLMGRRRIRRRSRHPHSTVPHQSHGASNSSPVGPPPGAWGLGGGDDFARKKKKLTCPFWDRKKFSSQPVPWYSAQGDSWGAGPPERARSALCSELGPEGEGKRGGWAPTSAPPPPNSAPGLHVGRPPYIGDAHSPRKTLGCPSPGPGVPARTNFLRVASPTRPTALARLGVTDASETDFPLFQRKGELARAPKPSPSEPRPRPPPPAVTRRPPVPLCRRAGGGGAAGG